jgi:hypothetical protein
MPKIAMIATPTTAPIAMPAIAPLDKSPSLEGAGMVVEDVVGCDVWDPGKEEEVTGAVDAVLWSWVSVTRASGKTNLAVK